MVKVDKLVKNYDDFRLDISMEIPDGTVTGIVGKNGAGKSTTIKAILGLIKPDEGHVTINGKEASMLTGKEKESIGAALSDSGFSSYLRIEDVICILRKMYPTFDEDFFRKSCVLQRLAFDKRIKDFSTGMRAKLRVLAAISHKSELLIMDEPTAAWCIGTVLYFIGNTVRRSEVNLIEELPMLIAFIPVMYLSSAIMLPMQLKYGSERSRIALFILFGCIAVLIFGAKIVFSGTENFITGLIHTIDNLSLAVVLLTVIIVCALASCVSYMISTRIMEKKEF